MLTKLEFHQIFAALATMSSLNISGDRYVSLQHVFHILKTHAEDFPEVTVTVKDAQLRFRDYDQERTLTQKHDPLTCDREPCGECGPIEDHQNEKHPTELEVDLKGWATAERLIDREQIESWKNSVPKRPEPIKPSIVFDGDPEVYKWEDRDLTWWQRTKRKLGF